MRYSPGYALVFVLNPEYTDAALVEANDAYI